jgi:hypothetical protein
MSKSKRENIRIHNVYYVIYIIFIRNGTSFFICMTFFRRQLEKQNLQEREKINLRNSR